MAFADDPGWPELIAEIDGPDAPPSAELLDALLAVLHDWRPEKPVVLVPVPVPGTGHHIRSHGMTTELGDRLQLPVADLLQWTGPPVPDGLASGATVAALETHLQMAQSAQVPAGPILLVAESARTRWSLTLAGALLREAGATTVLPLVAHLKP